MTAADGGRVPELERELRELGRTVRTPPPPDVTAAVLARLAATPSPSSGSPSPGSRSLESTVRGRRVPVRRVAAVLALALAGLAAVTPAGQAAIGGLLRFAGVEIEHGPAAPGTSAGPGSAAPGATSAGSVPGEGRTTLAGARARVAFPVGVPAALGAPAHAVVGDAGRVVTLVYPPAPGRPGGIRLDEFDGTADLVFFKKTAGQGGARFVAVRGAAAVFVPGPHEVVYTGRDGRLYQAGARMAASTLIWTQGSVTYRLEGDLTEERALEVAGSVPPPGR